MADPVPLATDFSSFPANEPSNSKEQQQQGQDSDISNNNDNFGPTGKSKNTNPLLEASAEATTTTTSTKTGYDQFLHGGGGERHRYLLYQSIYSKFARQETHPILPRVWERPNFLRDYEYIDGDYLSKKENDDRQFFIGLEDWELFMNDVNRVRACSRSCGKLFALIPRVILLVIFIHIINNNDDNVFFLVFGLFAIFGLTFIQHDASDLLYNYCFFHPQMESVIKSLEQRMQTRQKQLFDESKRQQPQQKNTSNDATDEQDKLPSTSMSYQPKVIVSLIVERERTNIWCGLVPAYRSYMEFFIPYKNNYNMSNENKNNSHSNATMEINNLV